MRVPVISRRMRYHTADANTVALWQGHGNLTDSSGNSLTLSASTGTERYGEVGYGLQGFALDGATRLRRNVNDAALNLAGDVTIEFIVRVLEQPAGVGAAVGCIVGYGAPGETGNNDNVYWQVNAGDATVGGLPNMAGVVTSTFFYEQGAGVNVVSTGGFLRPIHEPQHWAWVRTGTTLIPYVNGFAQTSFTGLTLGAVGGAPAQFLTIGADKDGASFFKGLVASMKISNVARSESYIRNDAIRCLGIGPGVLDGTGVTN